MFNLENNYLKSRVSLHRIFKNQDFHRRLAIQDVLTNLQKKQLTGQKKPIFQDWKLLIFSDEAVFQLRKTSKKTKLSCIDKLGEMKEGKCNKTFGSTDSRFNHSLGLPFLLGFGVCGTFQRKYVQL